MVIISIILIYLIGVYISYRFFKHIVNKKWEDYDERDEQVTRNASLGSWFTLVVLLYMRYVSGEL